MNFSSTFFVKFYTVELNNYTKFIILIYIHIFVDNKQFI